MSSFIVKPKTINRIVTFLDTQSTHNTTHRSTYRRLLAKYLIIPNTEESIYGYDYSDELSLNRQKLCDALYALNVEAVRQRYGEDNIARMPGHVATNQQLAQSGSIPYRPEDASKIQVFKSVQCLAYQCCEGNIPNSPLYKFLEELESTIARHIVTESPEYQKAQWD